MPLEKMTQQKYNEYFRNLCINELASQCVENGLWPAEGATLRAQQEQDSGLPNGVDTKDQYLLTIRDQPGNDVGSIYLGKLYRDGEWVAFLFFIHVETKYRDMGHATAAMKQIEELVRTIGIQKIQLHVFCTNQVAIKLYEKLGYARIRSIEKSIIMEKKVGVL